MHTLRNYVNGAWVSLTDRVALDVHDPGLGSVIARVPVSRDAEVGEAVAAAAAAYPEWRQVPPVERIQPFFRLKALMEAGAEELAQLVTRENGKALADARAEVRRSIQNVETACAITTLQMGYNLENGAAAGIDEEVLRQPLGVFTEICPFNFPLMVPFWFWPYAVATGNTFVVKPSERVPLAMERIFEMIDAVRFPRGVINLVQGDRGTAEALIDHPDVKGVSFVGSTPAAVAVFKRASALGKRVQAQGGAKNAQVFLPDAPLEAVLPTSMGSCFGGAGQRCLAGSLIIAVGEVKEEVVRRVVGHAQSLKVGYGLDPDVDMGPVVSAAARDRILASIAQAEMEGARVLVDGRHVQVPDYPDGFYVGPTVLDGITPNMSYFRTEVFGPVVGIMTAADLDEAMLLIDQIPFGNAAVLYTRSGSAARTFRSQVACGNIGINVGVPAPMSYFPFGGMKDSFFGTLHGQGKDAVDFFTDRKVVVTRWV